MSDADDTQKLPALFDPDLDPYQPVNLRAAKEMGIKYDPRKNYYVDVDGTPVRDHYGYPL